MLESLRRATRSWIFRGFLILLASTFVLYFGSGGSIFSGIANQPVAVIGRVEISQEAFADAYVRSYRQISEQLSPDQARQMGLPLDTLRQLVGEALLANAARELGVAVPDETVAAAIRAQVGNISPAIYQDVLRQNGYTMDGFETLVRNDLARSQVLQTVAPVPPVPGVLVDALHRYRGERRVAEVATIPESVVGEIEPPNDSTLVEYHSTFAAQYTAPEYREIAFIATVPDLLLDTVGVTEAEIVSEYELRLATYTTPDRREISQLFFADRATADAALMRVDEGIPLYRAAPDAPPPPLVEDVVARLEAEAPPGALEGPLAADAAAARLLRAEDEVAAAVRQAQEDIKLGWVQRPDLPAGVAEGVFAAELDTVVGPVQSDFGWHLYRIDGVEHGTVRTLEETREEIRNELALDEARAALFDLSIQVDDALAAGDTLEEAARRFGLDAPRITVDRGGRTSADEPSAALPIFSNFLPTAFATEEGRESRLIETAEGGFFVLRVDGVIPSALRPLEDVSDQVRQDWIDEERARRARKFAEAFVTRAQFLGLQEEARVNGYEILTTAPFTRTGQGLDIAATRAFAALLFDSAPHETVVVAAPNNAFHVARVVEVLPPEPGSDGQARDSLREQLGTAIAADLIAQYDDALEASHGVMVNDRALEQALAQATQVLPVPANL